MQNNKKRTILLVGALGLAIILGVVAVLTAMRLRQLATVPVAPNAPASQPQAAEAPVTISGCYGTFKIGAQNCGGSCTQTSDCLGSGGITLQCLNNICVNPLCTTNTTTCLCPTATPTVTESPTPTATLTPVPVGCNESCSASNPCEGEWVCSAASGNVCRNTACVSSPTCVCPTLTPTVTMTPTPTVTLTPTEKPAATPTVTPTTPPNVPTNTPKPTNTPAPTATLRPNAPTPIPTIEHPTIPQAGSTLPSYAMAGIGALLLITGLVLVMVW